MGKYDNTLGLGLGSDENTSRQVEKIPGPENTPGNVMTTDLSKYEIMPGHV